MEDFGMRNPIQSSYELLWRELKSKGIKSGIKIQYVMRRIIENYFKLLGKYDDEDLILNFNTKEEQEICHSLISWDNEQLYNIMHKPDDLHIEFQDEKIEIYKKVFKDIFVFTNHEEHYNMMMNENY